MIYLTTSLVIFYGVSSASPRDASAEGLQTGLQSMSKDGRLYDMGRHANCTFRGWVGEGVGMAGIAYLVCTL